MAGLATAVGSVVASPGCGTHVDETGVTEDAGDRDAEADHDAEAGPPLQCWCIGYGDGTVPSDHPYPGNSNSIKCDAGWFCGMYTDEKFYCCPPMDKGVPNCFDTDDGTLSGNIVTPNGDKCAPMPW
jgi:hypothetical protein